MIKKIFTLLGLILTVLIVNAAEEDEDLRLLGGERMKIIGWLQPQFRVFEHSVDANDGNFVENSFAFNRIRVGVTGSLSHNFSYFLMTDLSSFKGGPTVVKAIISWDGLGHWARITTGKFKHPFSIELNTSTRYLHTIYRSKVVDELTTPSVDYGLMISGGSSNLPILGFNNSDIIKYSLAIINGTGKNVYDSDVYKDLVCKLNFSPASFLSFGGSYRNGKRNLMADQQSLTGKSIRYGADISIHYKNLIFQSEYIGAVDEYLDLSQGIMDYNFLINTRKSKGYFVQTLYLIHAHLQPVLKYEFFSRNYTENRTEDQAVTLGFNYFFNDQAKVQMNYIHHLTNHQLNILNEDEITDALLIQFQYIF